MTLLSRQIKAVKATLEQVLEEYREGKERHHWKSENCPLCELDCEECPMYKLDGEEEGSYCGDFAHHYFEGFFRHIPLEDIAGFLKSLLITLEG